VQFLDKEELRRSLPLAYVCGELGVDLSDDGIGLCPFHEDSNPSFQLWVGDDGVHRFHCFPCGAGGDVFDLIRRLKSVSFTDALLTAEQMYEEMPTTWVAPTLRAAEASSGPDESWAAGLSQARDRALENDGWMCVMAGIVPLNSSPTVRRGLDAWLRDSWLWGVDRKGNIVMPHYDSDRVLTGIKFRSPDGGKWSMRGSSYPALYGAWRGRTTGKHVILCEGESDAVWAAAKVPNMTVFALPSGAGKFRDEWPSALNLTEDDVVYLAFDADEAGQAATQTWLAALGDHPTRVCRLPAGHDLRSASPDVPHMLSQAITPPIPPTSVVRSDTGFERVANNGQVRPMTNQWTMKPIAHLTPGDEFVQPAIEVNVTSLGRTWEDTLQLSDLHSSSKFRAWSHKRGLAPTVSDVDVQILTDLLLAESALMPEVFQTNRVGMHPAPSAYPYAGAAVAYPGGSIGRLPWRYVGPREIETKVHFDDTGTFDWDWMRAIFELNDPSVITPTLAWFVAATRRIEVTHFPMLFLSGSSGSGKTTTARLITKMFGSSIGLSLAAATRWSLLRTLSQTTTVPVFIDEWSAPSSQIALEAFASAITAIYEAGIVSRGRADLTVEEFFMSAPVVIAGEDVFQLEREVERMITVRLQRSSEKADTLRTLQTAPLQRFSHWFYEWLITAPDLPPMPKTSTTRPEYNRDCLITGWETLEAYLEHARTYDHDVPDLPPLDLSQIDDAMARPQENEYEAAVFEAATHTDSSGHRIVWNDPAGHGTYIRFRSLTTPYVMSRIDADLPGRSRAMKAYFEERYDCTDERIIPPMSDSPTRATLVRGFFL